MQQLRDEDRLDAVGGLGYIAGLSNSVPTAANVSFYAALVRKKALLRRVISVSSEIAEECYGDVGDVENFINSAEARLMELSSAKSSSPVRSLKDVVKEAYYQIEALYEQDETITGVPSGYVELDEITAGWQPSDLIIVAARPAMGKCLAADAEIVQADGRVVTIEEIVRAQEASLLTLGEDRRFRVTSPDAFVDDGHKPVFRVTTRLGRQVDTTLSHPFLTMEGWKPLEQLQEGTRVAVPREIPVFGTHTPPSHQAALLGEQGFSHPIAPEVFVWERTSLAGFLQQGFMKDGWVHEAEDSLYVGYTAATEHVARQVQHLLLRFGVLSTLTLRQDPHQDYPVEAWQLHITEALSLYRFSLEIGGSWCQEQLTSSCKPPASDGVEASQVYWDEIVSIEPRGVQQVYDLTIPDTHNFVANDVCVHNTAFTLNMAANAATRFGKVVLFCSLEMSAPQLAMRLMASEARVDVSRLRVGALKEHEWSRLIQATATLSKAHIFIDDTAGLTPQQLSSRTRRLKAEHGLDMIMIDYLQLMNSSRPVTSREQHISEVSRTLKMIAKEMNIPVIALAQLNRGVEQRADKRPMISDLRESGAIEQDADIISFVYRDEYYNPDSELKGIAEIIIGKNRSGSTGTVELRFFPMFTRFENLARNEEDE